MEFVAMAGVTALMVALWLMSVVELLVRWWGDRG